MWLAVVNQLLGVAEAGRDFLQNQHVQGTVLIRNDQAHGPDSHMRLSSMLHTVKN